MIVSLCNIIMYLLLAASILGVVLSYFLFKSPEKVIKFDNMLNKNIDVDSKGIVVDSKIDIEYIFFNHHISTSVIMFLLSAVLCFLSKGVVASASASQFIKDIFDYIRYILFGVSIIGMGWAIFILVSPKNAFLLMRALNRYVISLETKDADSFLQKSLLEKKIYLKYNVFFAVLIFVFSVVLFLLVIRYILF